MNGKLWSRILSLIVVAGLLAASGVALRRYRVEESNRTVELVLDYPEALRMARREEVPPRELLERFREAGVTSLAIGEYNLTDYLQGGNVLAYQGSDLISQITLTGRLQEPFASLVNRGQVNPRATYIVGVNPTSFRTFSEALTQRLGGEGIRQMWVDGRLVIEVRQGLASLASLSITLAPDQAALARRVGLLVAPRFGNFPNATPDKIRSAVARAPREDSSVAIFSGTQVLGYPAYLPDTARALEDQGLRFGLVEFADQDGEEQLAKELDYRIVRVHSITPGEMEKIRPKVAAARVVRAVRERGIRVLYLRPFVNPSVVKALPGSDGGQGSPTVDFNMQYVRVVRDELVGNGFRLGKAGPYQPLTSPLYATLLMILGTVAAGLLMLRRFVRLDWRVEGALLLVATGGAGLLLVKGYALIARQIIALAASIIFPTLGVLAAREWIERRKSALADRPRRGVMMLTALAAFGLATVITLPGALVVVGMLAETRFLVRISQFAGVKLTHAVPVLLVWLAIEVASNRRKHGRQGTPATLTALWREIREVLARPVTWEHAVMVGILGLLALFYLLRTGTYTGVPAPGFERIARDYLEQVLVIRPRTKEFLLGHPALFLALFLDLAGTTLPVWAIYLAGAIGQLSITNTFSHIHTPLAISAVRTVLGITLGLIIGAAAAATLRFLGAVGRRLSGRRTQGD